MDKVFEYDKLDSARDQILAQLHEYGFILVRGVPDSIETIQAFRRSARAFIDLTDEEKARCTPENFYEFGWSYGEEIFNGQRDSFKGSYYADLPEHDQNVWPDFETQTFDPDEFKESYLNVGRLVSKTGQARLGDYRTPPSGLPDQDAHAPLRGGLDR